MVSAETVSLASGRGGLLPSVRVPLKPPPVSGVSLMSSSLKVGPMTSVAAQRSAGPAAVAWGPSGGGDFAWVVAGGAAGGGGAVVPEVESADLVLHAAA